MKVFHSIYSQTDWPSQESRKLFESSGTIKNKTLLNPSICYLCMSVNVYKYSIYISYFLYTPISIHLPDSFCAKQSLNAVDW